jgi:hypothetical protein
MPPPESTNPVLGWASCPSTITLAARTSATALRSNHVRPLSSALSNLVKQKAQKYAGETRARADRLAGFAAISAVYRAPSARTLSRFVRSCDTR